MAKKSPTWAQLESQDGAQGRRAHLGRGGGGGAQGEDGDYAAAAGTAGTTNTGGGGGGSRNGSTGGAGGPGIVVLRVPTSGKPASFAVAPGTNTTFTDGSDTIAVFTVTGTLTL